MSERPEPDEPFATVTELIELGRDREAVEAATRRSLSRSAERDPHEPIERGEVMDGVQQIDEVLSLLEGLVDRIGPDQLELPTPCESFTVSAVLEHMTGGATAFAPAFRGEPSPSDGGSPDAGTPQERWGRAMAELAAAVHTPGAQDRMVESPLGSVPGATFARYVAFDGLVHGWDLATATGQPYDPPTALVAEIDGFARELLKPEMRDGVAFGAEAEAAPNAGRLERLVAFTGRRIPASGVGR